MSRLPDGAKAKGGDTTMTDTDSSLLQFFLAPVQHTQTRISTGKLGDSENAIGEKKDKNPGRDGAYFAFRPLPLDVTPPPAPPINFRFFLGGTTAHTHWITRSVQGNTSQTMV
jgi:hypothetical protein